MAVDLADHVDSLRREVTPPGSTLFSTVDDEVFIGYLTDAFWETRLDGFFQNYTADDTGLITPLSSDDVEMSREKISLILLYAGVKIVRNRLLSINTRFKAEAGPVSLETENSANLLTEMLRQLKQTKDLIVDRSYSTGDVFVLDASVIRESYANGYSAHLASWYSDMIS